MVSERDRRKRVFRSMPVAARIDLVSLANWVRYMEGQGVRASSMSMVVATAVNVIAAQATEKLVEPIDSLHEAYEFLDSRRLIQEGMRKRFTAKLLTGLGEENLEMEGESLEEYAPSRYKDVMNRSNRTYVVDTSALRNKRDSIWDEMARQAENISQEELDKRFGRTTEPPAEHTFTKRERETPRQLNKDEIKAWEDRIRKRDEEMEKGWDLGPDKIDR